MNWSVPILLALLAALGALAGCGTERDTQVKTVEKVESFTGPLVVDTPIGQFVAQPVKHTMIRTEDTVEREEKRISMPEVGAIMSVAPALAGPLGIAGTLLGVVSTAAAGWMALKRGRQRDELIDGNERSKDSLAAIPIGKDPVTGKDLTAWDRHIVALEATQSRDTIAAVKARTA